jgi:hypothetical protein
MCSVPVNGNLVVAELVVENCGFGQRLWECVMIFPLSVLFYLSFCLFQIGVVFLKRFRLWSTGIRKATCHPPLGHVHALITSLGAACSPHLVQNTYQKGLTPMVRRAKGFCPPTRAALKTSKMHKDNLSTSKWLRVPLVRQPVTVAINLDGGVGLGRCHHGRFLCGMAELVLLADV